MTFLANLQRMEELRMFLRRRRTFRRKKRIRKGGAITVVVITVSALAIIGAATAAYLNRGQNWLSKRNSAKRTLTDEERIRYLALSDKFRKESELLEEKKTKNATFAKEKMADVYQIKDELDSVAFEIVDASENLCEKIDRAINTISKHDFQGEQLTFELFEKLAAELLVEVDGVIDAHETFVVSAEDYERLLNEVRPHFLEAEKQFRDSAEKEYYHDIRENYLHLADIAVSIDVKLERKATAISPGISRINNSLRYAKSTEEFLIQLNDFLKGIPKSEVDAAELVSRLESYVSRFHEMQGVLERFSTKLKSQTESDQSPSAKPKAALTDEASK